MARLGIHCVRGNMTDSECQTCALDALHPCQYTPDALSQINNKRDEPGSDEFSPSRLLGCFRQPVLEKEYGWYQDVDFAYPFVRGNIVHTGFEHALYPGRSIVREHRVTTMVDTRYGPQPFTAKPDAIVHWWDGGLLAFRVIDYKTRQIDHQLVEADRKHQMQVNMYAWIVARAGIPGFPGEQPMLDGLEIVYTGINGMRRFVSDGSLTAKGKRIPKTQPQEYETLTLAPIHIVPEFSVEQYVRTRIEKKIEAREKLPPPLEGDAAKWCHRCPVFAKCQELAACGQ